jgi:hypothetical protein
VDHERGWDWARGSLEQGSGLAQQVSSRLTEFPVAESYLVLASSKIAAEIGRLATGLRGLSAVRQLTTTSPIAMPESA